MASFSQEIVLKYGANTYQEVRNTYEWVAKIAQNLALKNPKIEEEFLFSVGKMTCSAKNLAEFITNAYGMSDFEILNFLISVYDKDKCICRFSYMCGSFSVRSDSKEIIEKVLTLAERTTLDDDMFNSAIKSENVSINVSGNNNIIANDSSMISISATPESKTCKSKIHEWITAIAQNIAANYIWWILGLIGTVVIGNTLLN